MLLKDHVKFERRSETILSGEKRVSLAQSLIYRIFQRTLATDRGFKERVHEDMLVRLLDAFVWRNCGESLIYYFTTVSQHFPDKQETRQLGFTYVQGMNVLAAPFLYTMPSELEAFYCFSKFIEECCPLYVQPTLEGVHRGLKVYMFISFRNLVLN